MCLVMFHVELDNQKWTEMKPNYTNILSKVEL